MLTGIIPALLTPFTPDDEVNLEMLRRLVDYLIAVGIHGLYLCGSTGEGLLMSESERQLTAETVIAQVAGRVPVIVHVGAISTASACRLAAHAGRAGADAIASIPPFYYPVGRKEIEAHYGCISQAAGLPTFFYNIPDATNYKLGAELAGELYRRGVIQGLKYTSYDLLNLRGIIDACGPDLNVFAGPDEMLLPILVMGAHGGIGATYNCMPELYVELFRAWVAGDLARARECQFTVDRVIRKMVAYGIIPAAKAVMQMRGLDCGAPRLPLASLDAAQGAALRSELEALDFRFDLHMGSLS